jgi:hypothetical protein
LCARRHQHQFATGSRGKNAAAKTGRPRMSTVIRNDREKKPEWRRRSTHNVARRMKDVPFPPPGRRGWTSQGEKSEEGVVRMLSSCRHVRIVGLAADRCALFIWIALLSSCWIQVSFRRLALWPWSVAFVCAWGGPSNHNALQYVPWSPRGSSDRFTHTHSSLAHLRWPSDRAGRSGTANPAYRFLAPTTTRPNGPYFGRGINCTCLPIARPILPISPRAPTLALVQIRTEGTAQSRTMTTSKNCTSTASVTFMPVCPPTLLRG